MPGYGETGAYGEGSYKGEGISSQSSLLNGFPANKINYLTGVCLRLGIRPEHGLGWSFYKNGINWLWPMPNIKPISIIDDNGHRRFLIMDEITGRYFEYPTVDGPTGSGMVESWVDKESKYGGAEIPCYIKWKERTGDREHMKVNHIEGHVNMRPHKETDRNKSGYTDKGYRNAFGVAYSIYKDGELNKHAETKDIPDNGDLVFDRKSEGHRLQPRIDTTASSFKVPGIDPIYLIKDQAGNRSQRVMTEGNHQLTYCDPMFWISRGDSPLLDRATGELCTGDYFNVSKGPDSKESALLFSTNDSFSKALPHDLHGDFTIQFAVNELMLPVQICDFSTGNLEISIEENFVLRYNGMFDMYEQDLRTKGDSWMFIKVCRDGKEMTISKNGSILNTFSLTGMGTYGGTLTGMGNGIGKLFDFRIYNKVISDSAFTYYYCDVTENKGKALLPIW